MRTLLVKQVFLILAVFSLPVPALAHRDAGYGAIGLIGWPVVVVVCTLMARRGLRLLAFFLGAAFYPLSIYIANSAFLGLKKAGKVLSSNEIYLTAGFTASFWVMVIIVMFIAVLRRNRRGMVRAANMARSAGSNDEV